MGINRILQGFTRIANVSSRLKKEEIFKGLIKSDRKMLEEVLKYCFYPFWNYNITLDEKEEEPFSKNAIFNQPHQDLTWKQLKELLDKFRNGLSGNAAHDKLGNFMADFDYEYRYWIMRIVNRDLKMGLSDRTIKKYLPGLLPEVNPMLCSPLDIKTKNAEKEFKYKGWICEPKYDGLRALVIVEGGKATVVSRAGKPMWNVDNIIQEVESLGIEDAVFDGEIYGKDWNETISAVHTQGDHKQSGKMKYYIFDRLSLSSWKNKKCTKTQEERKEDLEVAFHDKFDELKFLRLSPVSIIKTYVDMHIALRRQLKAGFEGIVIKDPEGMYEWKRSKNWLKVKPIYEDDFKIVQLLEGTGKHRGKLGAIVVKGTTTFKGKKYPIYSKVGSGFLDTARQKIWSGHKGQKFYIGKTVQVEFQEVSEKKNEKGHALRFPIFIRFREDKDDDKD